MAKCRRDKCENMISKKSIEAIQKRLCDHHYKVWQRNLAQKDRNLNRKCEYCGNSLVYSRNKFYCSLNCKRRGEDGLLNKQIRKIKKDGCWQEVEKLIKNSYLGLDSINNLNDIIELFKLCQIKNSYNEFHSFNRGGHFPYLYVDIGYLFPLQNGGLNIAKNIVFIPKMINDRFKFIKQKRIFNSQCCGFYRIKYYEKPILVKNLFESIRRRYTKTEFKTMLQHLEKLIDSPPKKRTLFFKNKRFSDLPIFKLLRYELYRQMDSFTGLLSMDSYKLKRMQFISVIRQLSENIHSGDRNKNFIYIELFAITVFHALISGDKEKYIKNMIDNINRLNDL